MHADRVGVGVRGMGVLVAVGVEVLGSDGNVGWSVTVGEAGAISSTKVAVGSCIMLLVGVSMANGMLITPQACTSDSTTKGTTSLLHTHAVYHKILVAIYIKPA